MLFRPFHSARFALAPLPMASTECADQNTSLLAITYDEFTNLPSQISPSNSLMFNYSVQVLITGASTPLTGEVGGRSWKNLGEVKKLANWYSYWNYWNLYMNKHFRIIATIEPKYWTFSVFPSSFYTSKFNCLIAVLFDYILCK